MEKDFAGQLIEWSAYGHRLVLPPKDGADDDQR